jgi:hypothetical protein
MPLLSDDPIPSRRSNGGAGNKFLRIYRSLDPEDQERIRRWHDEGRGHTFIHQKLSEHFEVSYTTTERGIWRLEAASWEC